MVGEKKTCQFVFDCNASICGPIVITLFVPVDRGIYTLWSAYLMAY